MQRITQDFINKLPVFKDHKDAYDFFEENFKNFRFAGLELLDGQYCRNYDIVYDMNAYGEFLEMKVKALENKEISNGKSLGDVNIYHRVKIFENGNVYI
ncbi:hypothetical protein LLR47_17170 [Bacillus cereus]|uniref:hypothetical protein n=1 Tax=Bacillus cereus TaxID=1396 RepID=UPI001D15B1BC|nr:hypothetical protein [Bacillus cereus]MCC3686960.1 hypothetical protein [Bacillus cereus]